MIDISWEEFWWNNITGAHVVVSKVSDALLENKMVVLKVPSDLPWRYSMRSSMQSAFQEKTDTRDVVIESIDVVDDNPENLEPGKFLLQKYASSTVSRGYREKSRVSIQDYIVQKDVIKNRILWVKGLEGENANKWIKFCKGFTPKTAVEGLFVLEIHGAISQPESRFIEYIDFSDYVSNYDVQLFNSFVLDNEEAYSDVWKRYISTVAAMVCGVDAEVSEMLLRDLDFRRESIITGIAHISDNPEYSRRGTGADSDHVLWLYRNNKTSELRHRIWAAQVQVLFPIIELERIEIIEKYAPVISSTLSENNITQYGEKIVDPMDVELGTLCYMMSYKKRDDFYMYMLYIPDANDRERIKFLHECRNKLAHVSSCEPEEVRRLLDKEMSLAVD